MESEDLLNELEGGRLDIVFNPQMKNTLFNLAKWVKLIAVTTLVIMGLALLLIIFGGSALMATLNSNAAFGSEMGVGVGMMMLYCIVFAFGIYMMYLLYDFATKMQVGLKSNNEVLIEQAFNSMRRHYKIYGIFIIIYLVFAAIGLLMAIIGGLGALM
jgi:hypothetical protein